MEYRKKILILESDDFLRELLGNLMHKQGAYILNGFTIAQGIDQAKNQSVDTVILGTSCSDFDAKHSIHFINKELNNPKLFVINHGSRKLKLENQDQMLIKDLNVTSFIEQILK